MVGSPHTSSIPRGSARVATTAATWGWTPRSTKKADGTSPPARLVLSLSRRSMVIASAAAVASSSMEALASSHPVRSATIVW